MRRWNNAADLLIEGIIAPHRARCIAHNREEAERAFASATFYERRPGPGFQVGRKLSFTVQNIRIR